MAKQEHHYKLNLGFTLYPLQQTIYDHVVGDITNPITNDPYYFFVLCFGRQSGKSFFCKKLALDRAINMREKVMWVAPAISTAQTHWDDIEAVITRAQEKGFKIKSINQSRKQIKFLGGGQITIRSAIQPDRLRGPSLDLIILDEAAFFPDGKNTFESIIQPMVTATGGKIVLASTPNGRNWFYDIYKKGLDPKNEFYKSWTSTSFDSPYQNIKLLEEIRTSIPAKKWREEYLAEFLADAGGVFAGVEEASTLDMLYAPLPGHDYVMGVDIGFVNDETAVCIIDKYTREQVYGESWSNVGTLPTLRRLAALFDLWQPEVTLFEKNGLGETFFDLIKAVFSGRDPDEHLLSTIYDDSDSEYDPYDDSYINHYGDPDEYSNIVRLPGRSKRNEIRVNGMTIRGVHMNNEMKRAFVDGLSADVEYRRLKLLNDKSEYGMKQINQMSTYERKPTVSGMSVTYAAQDGEHDDLVAALYLARKALPKMTRQKTSNTNTTQQQYNPFRGGRKSSSRWHKRGA